jgi:hypothetical protein
MNRVPAVSLVLLFGSMTVTAQSLVLDRQPAVLNGVPMSSDCPIGMRVEQQGAGEQMLRANSDRPKGIAQQLQVIMSNSSSLGIVGARITAHGFAAKTHSLPAQYPRTGSPELTKTVDLKLTMSSGSAYSDIRLPGFTAVSVIDLDSVTYADGSTWHSSAGKTCHAVPDRMMLISSR